MRTLEQQRDYYNKHKQQLNQNSKRYKQRKKVLALKLIGDKCVICGSTIRLCFHEKHGLNHNTNTESSFYLKHPENFIALCYYHHKLVHAVVELSDVEKVKLQEIIGYIKARSM